MNTTTLTAPPSVVSLVPVLPASAPFTAAQRAWLNGFFAGIFGSSSTDASPTPTPVEAEEEFPWHDPAIAIGERLKLADEKPIERKLMAAMAQLDCGACGYLCKTYAESIAEGKEKDLTRCTPGGRDTARMLKQLSANMPKVVAVSEVGVKKDASVQNASTYDRNNPFPARLIGARRLNSHDSSKDTRLVAIDLKNSGITYKVGDALGVFPENCPDLVQDVLEALAATGAEDVPGWDGMPMSLHDALLREFSIGRPSPDFLDLLSRSATDADEAVALKAMQDDENGCGEMHVLDVLSKFSSARPAPGDLVATLSPLAPRLYSISSSLLAHPNEVHLTVGTVRYKGPQGRPCKGVASTYLAERVRPGQKVRIFVHPSHKFGLPSPEKHVIMVGPGTGVAPFRAFLQERAATKAAGKNWLFFGDQKSDCDFLFREELTQYQNDGVLSRLDTAFSRDQDAKVYVQDRILENGGDLWRWLEDGAYFYICGDAKRMAADVDKALKQVIAEHGKLDADKYVADLIRTGRYQRDVY